MNYFWSQDKAQGSDPWLDHCDLTDVSYRERGWAHVRSLLVAASPAHLGSSWPHWSYLAQITLSAQSSKQGSVSLLPYWEQTNIWAYFLYWQWLEVKELILGELVFSMHCYDCNIVKHMMFSSLYIWEKILGRLHYVFKVTCSVFKSRSVCMCSFPCSVRFPRHGRGSSGKLTMFLEHVALPLFRLPGNKDRWRWTSHLAILQLQEVQGGQSSFCFLIFLLAHTRITKLFVLFPADIYVVYTKCWRCDLSPMADYREKWGIDGEQRN